MDVRACPNFLIAGGVASGTSFLSAALATHPDIYLPYPQRPEPNFFHYSWKFEQGFDWWIDTWFKRVGVQRAVGERSSLLLTSDAAPWRILETVPDIKLIFCLRNPIERAWGNYRFTVLEGLEELTFSEALDVEQERSNQAEGRWSEVRPHAYLERSRYSDHLREYIELFGPSQVLMLKSEDMSRAPAVSLAQVCAFLNLDSSEGCSIPASYTSPSVRDRGVQVRLRAHFGERFSALVESIRTESDVRLLVDTEEDRQALVELRGNLMEGKQPLSEADRTKVSRMLSEELQAIRSIVPFETDDWV
jgi:hypothetical protein